MKPYQLAAKDAQQRISRTSPFKLKIRRSGIHRFGVFAGQDIPAKARVIEYTGERISFREARQRFLRIMKDHAGRFNYLARAGSHNVIDGAVGGSGAELMNHSCDPNMRDQRTRGRIWLVSLRRIRKGEELVLDYRFPKKAPPVRCRCGSAACRGTINLR